MGDCEAGGVHHVIGYFEADADAAATRRSASKNRVGGKMYVTGGSVADTDDSGSVWPNSGGYMRPSQEDYA